MALKIFVDFDGTITKRDVGNAFFREFGGETCSKFIAEYRSEAISAKELFRSETSALGLVNVKNAERFLRGQTIDEGFGRFVEFCNVRGIELHIVSDGLDYYIEKILVHNGIRDVSFFANRFVLEVVEGGLARPEISFPYDDAVCSRCACCKRNLMLTKTGESDITAYVGEGYSDRCPAQYADIVFAKDDLQRFCQERNISYILYDSFDDVILGLEKLFSHKRWKKRREAEMNRREAFRSE